MLEVSGPRPCVCSSADVLRRLGRLERGRVVGEEDDPGVQVVLQVAADGGLVEAHVDAERAQLVGRADAREHQQLRRLVGAGGQDHLALGLERGRHAVDARPRRRTRARRRTARA